MKLRMFSGTNFLIVHGSRGEPDGNWFPWLKQKLENLGGKVFAPQFPTPENQSFDAWHKVAEQALSGCAAGNTVLIGHSTGAVFVLRMAELAVQPYRSIFSVCPFVCDLGLKDYDNLNADFVHHAFSWPKVAKGALKITCLAGDNDPYVPLERSEDIAANIGTRLIVIEKAGHLNAESGYREFPLLLEKIRE
jgi:uncharacterized protein